LFNNDYKTKKKQEGNLFSIVPNQYVSIRMMSKTNKKFLHHFFSLYQGFMQTIDTH